MLLLVRLRISKKYNNPKTSSPPTIPPITYQGTAAATGAGVVDVVSVAAGITASPHDPIIDDLPLTTREEKPEALTAANSCIVFYLLTGTIVDQWI